MTLFLCMCSRALQSWTKYFQIVLSGTRRRCFLKCLIILETKFKKKFGIWIMHISGIQVTRVCPVIQSQVTKVRGDYFIWKILFYFYLCRSILNERLGDWWPEQLIYYSLKHPILKSRLNTVKMEIAFF